MSEATILEQATESILRMQQFDTKKLIRREELGLLNFQDAVEPADRVVGLYKRLGLSVLVDFPVAALTAIKNTADADYSRLRQILDFSVATNNPAATKDQLIYDLRAAYDNTFNFLWQYIAYGVSKITDTQRLESEARGVLQGIKDEAEKTTSQIKQSAKDAQDALAEIRSVAAEQGVSQQALYFKDEAATHEQQAEFWKEKTVKAAWYLGGFAAASFVAAYVPFLAPTTNLQAIQLLTSKVIIFAVLGYWLALCARNFMSHKHNQVVNRHRENALKTFKALSEGAANPDNKDIILTHASQCIFSPQDTGYTHSNSSDSGTSLKSVIEILPKALGKDTK